MNQKIKYIGLFAILPLAMVALAPELIGDAYALQKAEGSPGTAPPKSYGSATADIVCGGALCGETTDNSVPISTVSHEVPKIDPPVIRIVSVTNFSGESENTFNAIFQLSAGNENIEDVQIVIESDRDVIWTIVNGLFAHDSSINSVKIQAIDPTSITAIIVDYQIND